MTRKKCMRKIWSTAINPVTHAMQGAAITPIEELNKLRVKEANAIDAFDQGRATLRDFDSCCALVNICEELARRGIGPEALETCQSVQNHLIEASVRFERENRMALDSGGVLALRDLYCYHELHRQSISRAEYEAAIRKVVARVQNKAPGVIEL